jgi:hypothetical protein
MPIGSNLYNDLIDFSSTSYKNKIFWWSSLMNAGLSQTTFLLISKTYGFSQHMRSFDS